MSGRFGRVERDHAAVRQLGVPFGVSHEALSEPESTQRRMNGKLAERSPATVEANVAIEASFSDRHGHGPDDFACTLHDEPGSALKALPCDLFRLVRCDKVQVHCRERRVRTVDEICDHRNVAL
jgi:hypothetical protein